eukprot:4169181-Pleurochrysis_carterae.AAC.1
MAAGREQRNWRLALQQAPAVGRLQRKWRLLLRLHDAGDWEDGCALTGTGEYARRECLVRVAASSGLSSSPSTNRPRARERSAATLASSSALACWVEKGWSEGGMLRHVGRMYEVPFRVGYCYQLPTLVPGRQGAELFATVGHPREV